jgi:tetratricopeptide (TPR) repeat protein
MQQVLGLNPQYFDALTACAVILDNTGQKDEAQAYFQKALAIEPENKYLRVNYARSLATGGKIPEAIQAYSSLVQDYPQEYILFQYLGIAYGVAGDYANAIKNLEQAVSLNPTPTAYFNLGVAYKETGEIAEAIRALEIYLENPTGEDEASIRSVQAELQNLRKKLL